VQPRLEGWAHISWFETRKDALLTMRSVVWLTSALVAVHRLSNVAEELGSGAISTIGVGDLAASHDVVAVTRRGGFLSAASRRLLEIIRAHYRAKPSGRAKPSRAHSSESTG
jgi:hypothetical protein